MCTATELTQDELSLLTNFDLAAYSLHRLECQEKDEVPPAWLVMSDEARQEIRSKFMEWGAGRSSWPHFFDEHTVRGMLARNSELGAQTEVWIACEADLKKARAEGNPRAWFMG